MTSQTFSLEGQPVHFQLTSRNSKRQARGRGYVSGWLILAFLSAFVGGWFLYRLLFRPEWPGALPPAAAELLNLVELAAAFTLIVLWAGLLWRHRASQASTPGDLGGKTHFMASPEPKASRIMTETRAAKSWSSMISSERPTPMCSSLRLQCSHRP